MFDNRIPSSLQKPVAAEMPSVDIGDFQDAVVGGGDPRIAELVNEARAQGHIIKERPSTPLSAERGGHRPPWFEKVGD